MDASRTYPRALAVALPFVTLGYIVPLLAALGATDWTTWTDGGWPQIAAAAAGGGGRWIAAWIALGGMVSALALFNALLLSYSRIPLVLANDRLLPQALAKIDARGTPRNAVLISAAFYSLFVLVPFGKLVIADVLLYALALFLEFGALIQLRKTEPSLRGSFRIPTSRNGVMVLAMSAWLACTFSAVLSAVASILSATFSAFASMLSAVCSFGLLLQAASEPRPSAIARTVVVFIVIPLLLSRAPRLSA